MASHREAADVGAVAGHDLEDGALARGAEEHRVLQRLDLPAQQNKKQLGINKQTWVLEFAQPRVLVLAW